MCLSEPLIVQTKPGGVIERMHSSVPSRDHPKYVQTTGLRCLFDEGPGFEDFLE
jgi:hypothetical protein